MKSATSSRFDTWTCHRRRTRSGARVAPGSCAVVRGVRRAGVTPRQPLACIIFSNRAPRHRDAMALQLRPHLQAAVQALRRAFARGVGLVDAGRISVMVVSHSARFDGAPARYAK